MVTDPGDIISAWQIDFDGQSGVAATGTSKDDDWIDLNPYAPIWPELLVDAERDVFPSGLIPPSAFDLADVSLPGSVVNLSSASGSGSSTGAEATTSIEPMLTVQKVRTVGRKRARAAVVHGKRASSTCRQGIGDEEAALAVEMLKSTLAEDHTLGRSRNMVDPAGCSKSSCFLLTQLDSYPSHEICNYFGAPLPTGEFAVRLLDPSNLQQDNLIAKSFPGRFHFSRPAGRSVHLIVTALPDVADENHLSSGFALIFACRRQNDTELVLPQSWKAESLVTFEKSASGKGRSKTGADIAFKGNMEHCVDESSGRRLWGLRTSHVKRTKGENQKAIRIQPKSNLGALTATDVCFIVALFTDEGELLRHKDGSPCIAQTNTVTFEPTKPEQMSGGTVGILRELAKLSFEERVDLSNFTTLGQTIRTVLTSLDVATRARVGQIDFASTNQPPTARYLSHFLGFDPSLPQVVDIVLPLAYKIRVAAVARAVGWFGADEGLTDPTPRFLHTLSTNGAAGRYAQIKEAGIEAATAWLREIGVTDIDVTDVYTRSEMTGCLMKERKFCSPWTVTLTNVYPDRILVDTEDPGKVHCLADTIFEADVGLRDRLLPLARLAFCSKLTFEDMEEYILQPYIDGFMSRQGDLVTVDREAHLLRDRYTVAAPFSSSLLDEEKFHLILHGMHLDYFLYWTRFRNPISVQRLAKKLRDSDKRWSAWYFAPGRFIPLFSA